MGEVRAHVPEVADRATLEVGCGTGGFLAASARAGLRPVGVDIAFRWLVVARRRLEEAGVEVPLVCACAEHLPFADETFGLVVSESTLEHVRAPLDSLREARRVLVPSGRLSLSTTNRFTLAPEPHVGVWGVGFLPRRWMSAYVGLVRGRPYQFIRSVSAAELRGLLRQSGFRAGSIEAARAPSHGLYAHPTRVLVQGYQLLRAVPVARKVLAQIAPNLEVLAECEPFAAPVAE
jgi:SAM-dependent methyltransferase